MNNGNGISSVVALPVAPVAPAIFSGAVLRRADNSLVTAANPAQARDVLVV